MAYKACFLDNATYGASEINAITKRLVSSGVADVLADGVSYNCSKINNIVSLVSTAGVVPESVNSLKCSVVDGKVIIEPGLAFFSDGSSIEITLAEELPFAGEQTNYVYVKSDSVLNQIYPACTTGYPTGDFVLLAQILSNGDIFDKRSYAKGKLPGYQSYANMTLAVTKNVTLSVVPLFSNDYTGSFQVDIGVNNYKYIEHRRFVNNYLTSMFLYDIAAQNGHSVALIGGGTGERGRSVQGYSSSNRLYFYMYSDNRFAYIDDITISNGVATFSVKGYNTASVSTWNLDVHLTFIAQGGDL